MAERTVSLRETAFRLAAATGALTFGLKVNSAFASTPSSENQGQGNKSIVQDIGIVNPDSLHLKALSNLIVSPPQNFPQRSSDNVTSTVKVTDTLTFAEVDHKSEVQAAMVDWKKTKNFEDTLKKYGLSENQLIAAGVTPVVIPEEWIGLNAGDIASHIVKRDLDEQAARAASGKCTPDKPTGHDAAEGINLLKDVLSDKATFLAVAIREITNKGIMLFDSQGNPLMTILALVLDPNGKAKFLSIGPNSGSVYSKNKIPGKAPDIRVITDPEQLDAAKQTIRENLLRPAGYGKGCQPLPVPQREEVTETNPSTVTAENAIAVDPLLVGEGLLGLGALYALSKKFKMQGTSKLLGQG